MSVPVLSNLSDTMESARSRTRSPLKTKTLPQAGQSLHGRLGDLVWNEILTYVVLMIVFVLWAAAEWVCYIFNVSRSPYLFTGMAGAVVVYDVFKIRRARMLVSQMRLGLAGERAVGEILDELRANRYEVFHDLQGNEFNVDHVLIGPTGVFALETKTLSKPGERVGNGSCRPCRGSSNDARRGGVECHAHAARTILLVATVI